MKKSVWWQHLWRDRQIATLEQRVKEQAEQYSELIAQLHRDVAERDVEIKRLRKYCFKAGLMAEAPCFNCGYNGPGYFNPETHACAKFHHKALGGAE